MPNPKPFGTLQLKDRVFESLGGGKYLSFKDFVVNGVSLYDKLYKTAQGGDITLFNSKWGSDEAAKYSERLPGNEPPDLENGRVSLYVCSECADPGCGLMSVLIRHEPGQVIWENFAWQDFEPDIDIEPGLGPFTFEQKQYEIARN